MAWPNLTRDETLSERLERLSEFVPWSGCKIWLGCSCSNGYGQTRIRTGGARGPKRLVHRIAWEISNGPIPDGIQVLHKCDVRSCVNVNHLFLGTNDDNAKDCQAKGRKANKLSAETVRAILADPRGYRIIGKQYGVSESSIGAIKRGKHWAHISKSAATNRYGMTYRGRTLKEWSASTGLDYKVVWQRYSRGDRGDHLFRPIQASKSSVLRLRE